MWAFGLKVSVTQVFNFCNGKVKTCASTTFEILPLSTWTLCQQKSCISKRYWTDFRNLWFSSKMLKGGHLVWIVSLSSRYFAFAMTRWKLCAVDNIWNFATFNVYTVPAKILYLQRHSTDFRKLFSARRCWGRTFAWKVSGAQVSYVAMASWELCAVTTFEILPLLTCTLCQQKSCISKGVQPIFEIFPSARRYWGCAFGWKVAGVQAFYFCNGNVKTCASTTFEILPLSTCVL